MDDEYIRKHDAVKASLEFIVEYLGGAFDEELQKGLKNNLESLKPADVAPVVHGTWLPIVSYNNTYKCSECGRLLVDITDGLKMVAKNYPYCHCGAKMNGEE